MIKCPKCQATLPDGAERCQFCGATFTPAVSRAVGPDDEPGRSVPLQWVWPAYYGIAAWWIFNGLYSVVQTVWRGQAGSAFGIVGIGIGALTALVGLGLILRVELARGIVNVLCFLQILDGAFGLLGSFLMSFAFGLLGAIAMIMSILQIALAVLMIFVIGETESRAANL
jgi:hypothetical protein